MNLRLVRKYRLSGYTIGKLYVNGTYFCDTMEDYDRLYFGKPKVHGKTAIPVGYYRVALNVYSPRFGKKKPYIGINNGCIPRLRNVPQFEGVLIHVGNTAEDTDGCILVGENKAKGKVINSTATYVRLMKNYLIPARKNNEEVWIRIE